MIVRFLKHTFILIIILFLFVYITGRFDNKIIPEDINVVKAKYSYLYDSLDYLIMGNSYVYSGIDPRILDSSEFKCYNFGISTAGVDYYTVLLEDYFKNIKEPPKTILFLVNPMTFSSASDNWQAYSIHRYLVSPVSNEYIVFRFNNYSNYLGMLKKSSTKGFRYFISLFKEKQLTKIDSIINNKGFYPSNETYNLQIYKNDINFYTPFLSEEFSIKKVITLIKLAEKYQSMNINIIFFEIPTFKLNTFFSKDYLVEYKKSLELIKTNNFNIIPYNAGMDSSCFRNIDHLNNKGAEIYTRFLIQYLKEHE